MGPTDYTLEVQQPFQSAAQGYQLGAAIRTDQAQQRQLQQQQAMQAQRQDMLSKLATNPNATADDYAAVMTAMPDLAEHLTKAWAAKNTAQQQSHASEMLQLGAAIKSGKPEFAVDKLTAKADMIEQQAGAPTSESQALRTQAQLVKDHPEFALGQIQAILAVNPNGKDAAETLSKFGAEQRAQELQPAAVKEAAGKADKVVAEAKTAAVTAKYAEPTALKDLELKGWNVENIKSEIGFRKESNRIAAMNAAANRESNALRRQELRLKIQETTAALEDKARAKVADVQSAASSIDNLLNTVDRIKQNPSLNDVVGSIEGRLPSVMSDAGADAIALIETLGSQAFMSQIPSMKGTGALSEKEGDKLQSSLQNLSRTQSEKQFRANLDEVQRLMLKARKNVETRYGVKAGVPDTPAVTTPPEGIDALVSKYLNPTAPGAR